MTESKITTVEETHEAHVEVKRLSKPGHRPVYRFRKKYWDPAVGAYRIVQKTREFVNEDVVDWYAEKFLQREERPRPRYVVDEIPSEAGEFYQPQFV